MPLNQSINVNHSGKGEQAGKGGKVRFPLFSIEEEKRSPKKVQSRGKRRQGRPKSPSKCLVRMIREACNGSSYQISLASIDDVQKCVPSAKSWGGGHVCCREGEDGGGKMRPGPFGGRAHSHLKLPPKTTLSL